MEKKYIIELPENTHWIQWIMEGTKDHHPYMDYKQVEDLTPYTDPDLDAIRKEAYAEGYKEGMQLSIDDAKLKEEYQRGLNDAWECAKKIALVKEDGGLDTVAYCETFGYGKGFPTVLKTHTASEAIEKIRQYEEKEEKEEKEQIQIGDEVVNMQTGVRFIVTHIWFNNHGEQGVSGFNHDCSAFSTTLSLVVKTGRHFPEITEVLRKMRENTNG